MVAKQIAKHFREVYFGGNWTSVNLKATLAEVTWQQSTTQVYQLNSIATLVYHIHYYVSAVLQVLQGGPLTASDTYSFNHPPVEGPEDWNNLLQKVWSDAENFAALLEQLPDDRLWLNFTNEKYGTYYRNMHGIVEHAHYHLGQIALIKKILQQGV